MAHDAPLNTRVPSGSQVLVAFQDFVKGHLDTLPWGTTAVIMKSSLYAVWNVTSSAFDDVHAALLLQTHLAKNLKWLILSSNADWFQLCPAVSSWTLDQSSRFRNQIMKWGFSLDFAWKLFSTMRIKEFVSTYGSSHLSFVLRDGWDGWTHAFHRKTVMLITYS